MNLGPIAKAPDDFFKRRKEYMDRICQAGESLSIGDIRELYIDRLMKASEKEAAKEIGQFLFDAMDAWEQSNIDEAIIAASDAYVAKIDPALRSEFWPMG
jgi:hypothetical protein